ncbi:SAM-dependent DNA methyltransferase [Belnapia sp. T6]|uniref:site-specific DNA-methyltransferase (adenine-specific) n=1 Tax=Belnapia mucosa TaxID=2804532 RepID=A0ABS1VAZ1_9PROT|nr:N-6 DNA methylase [Belnapia mucosa]MBL6458844.1 SAM-dependent DNA methyltransferase [Belnapia mucosa]
MSADAAIEVEPFSPDAPKESGAYFTPDPVARSLVRWAVRSEADRLLDPACGSGHFVALHFRSVGIEQNSRSAAEAIRRAPAALIHDGDFFTWAERTTERFECAAGNPPFIRYQTFKGEVRQRAQALCTALGADFSGLSSSWAPFLVATASLLKKGGRMAFVVPAEIGHAPYSAPLIEYLVGHFTRVHIVAVREKLFPELAEDCWLLHADGYGGKTAHIAFTALDRFTPCDTPPKATIRVPVTEWRGDWNRRLRPYLMPAAVRDLYQALAAGAGARRLSEVALVGIGYVTGANEFFHLRPSQAERWGIPDALLHPTVRNGRALPEARLTPGDVAAWRRGDEPSFLLKLSKGSELPASVKQYLATEEAREAKKAYKCRVRDPWYSVPDVRVPDFFLTYMSGRQVGLVRNEAGATCTNSVHAVQLKSKSALKDLLKLRESPLFQLSSELEGHPLGGGMLKLEPREAGRILLPDIAAVAAAPAHIVEGGIAALQTWRHYAD